MEKLQSLVKGYKWPDGFADTIANSKNHIAHRFLILNNSSAMLKKDSHLLDQTGSVR